MGNTSVDLTPFGSFISDHAGIHFVGGMEHGMTALRHALWWHETYQQASMQFHEQIASTSPLFLPEPPADNWPEFTARDFLQTHRIPVVPGLLATSAAEAVYAAQIYSFPRAM